MEFEKSIIAMVSGLGNLMCIYEFFNRGKEDVVFREL